MLPLNDILTTQLAACNYSFTARSIVKEFESINQVFGGIKLGEMTVKDGLDILEKNNTNRVLWTVILNLAKIMEIVFWCSLSSVFATACGASGAIIALNPLAGYASVIANATLSLITMMKAISCFNEFTPFDADRAQSVREKNLSGFFQPAATGEAVKGSVATGEYVSIYPQLPATDAHP